MGSSSPICMRSLMDGVAGASTVTITARAPNPCNSVTSAAESARGGSLSAISPLRKEVLRTAAPAKRSQHDNSSFLPV